MRRIPLGLTPIEVIAPGGVRAPAALRGGASELAGAIGGACALLAWALEVGGEVEAMSAEERRDLATHLRA